ncbi:MAG: hypothetical protein ACK48W_04645 [Bacteroidota bacterium]
MDFYFNVFLIDRLQWSIESQRKKKMGDSINVLYSAIMVAFPCRKSGVHKKHINNPKDGFDFG